ncbi:DUF6308 family protein [Blastococcus tunisiensis]|uniref:Uncharacterized protein n=1 Tax=Blastococcus tunisiensis TaxID=1798228 RepID=A0A1I2B6L1_9ACTN|nr:DUF6308 family protein [Blastococcus sp. DSM 46838]SFE51726.1 hypothetical protein SAMN05216574_10468 [Blastococcus sp. DSM 46838]
MPPFLLPSASPEPMAWSDALAAVLGYARAQRDLWIRRTPSHPDGITIKVRAYAYSVYDCVPPSPDDEFAWLDVLVVDGINGKMDQAAITALKDAGDRAWPHVRTAIERADGRAFWELPEVEVGRTPPPGTTGAALGDAWLECTATTGIKTALTHKMLHHKRPALFPLIDNVAAPLLRAHTDDDVNLWGVLHRELGANDEQFTALEGTFAELVNGEDDVPLTRLRLHDILVWLTASRRWNHAVAAGRETAEWGRWQSGTAS